MELGHPHAKGRIGIIAPYSRDFCASCNRLRMAADGKLHLCLFGDGGIDLRPLLAADDPAPLVARIRALVGTKAPAHRLRSEEHTSELQSLMSTSYAVFCLKKKKNSKCIHQT